MASERFSHFVIEFGVNYFIITYEFWLRRAAIEIWAHQVVFLVIRIPRTTQMAVVQYIYSWQLSFWKISFWLL